MLIKLIYLGDEKPIYFAGKHDTLVATQSMAEKRVSFLTDMPKKVKI